jgi:hypothetical protein
MASVSGSKGAFSFKAYQGDFKTMLAFDFTSAADASNLAGFTIQCQPPGQQPYYLLNFLRFQDPTRHAQVASEPPESTVNAPIQKYRWTHVPGSNHQGLTPAAGNYTYTVTPRFFDANGSMKPLDASLSASAVIAVQPFKKGALTLGFTRGYMQSQAFARHFGSNTPIEPAAKPLQFDTTTVAGQNKDGQNVTYKQIYEWMGSTARQWVFDLLDEVLSDNTLQLDVFAYDLDEPDAVSKFLTLAAQGRMRMILDNCAEHHTADGSKHEDQFEKLFQQKATAGSGIVRGSFARYSHDKIFIVSSKGNPPAPLKVLTGSTNFSVNGLYVNANHVLVFDDPNVAAQYAKVFAQSWQVLKQFPTTSAAAANAFNGTPLATQPFAYQSAAVPRMSVTFSPHLKADVDKVLQAIADRVTREETAAQGNVVFAVMQLTGSQSPVYITLNGLHQQQSLFSYGISDAPSGTFLYSHGSKNGVLVTGKPGKTTLPPPFNQVPLPPGHEIHDKFVVCGINGRDPVVYCGSSNLASGGEAQNGDNLLEIHDADVATAFAIEALLLVDHYAFLDRCANPKAAKPAAAKATVAGPAVGATKPAAKSAAKKAPAKTVVAKKSKTKRAAAGR